VTTSAELRDAFGEIDIYLFDQLLKGRFDTRLRVLDAGCGDGRNLHYLLRAGFDCFGIDEDARSIDQVRRRAAQLAPALAASHFVVGDLAALPWDAASMDAVICSAVLHFSKDAVHFGRMLTELWRVLAPGGLLFARLASNIGLERVSANARRSGCACPMAAIASSSTNHAPRVDRSSRRAADRSHQDHQRARAALQTTWCLAKANGHENIRAAR
jgi:SAM-dependent methyltransferase